MVVGNPICLLTSSSLPRRGWDLGPRSCCHENTIEVQREVAKQEDKAKRERERKRREQEQQEQQEQQRRSSKRRKSIKPEKPKALGRR